MNDPIAIRAKAVENLVFAVSQLSEDQQRHMGYRKEEFITKFGIFKQNLTLF